jgi:DNA-binding MarR family transcriptional regulator
MPRTRTPDTNRRPGPPPEIRAALLLSRLGRDHARRFLDGLAPVGRRPKQFALLNDVALAAGSSQRQIGRRLSIDPSGLVATIDELQRRGLIERRPDRDDRRRHALHLTDEGRSTLDEGRAVARRAAGELFSGLRGDEVAQLADLLGRIAATHDAGLAAEATA